MSSRVTYLMANYNYGRFLEGALNSAINQTYDNLGIVLINDGCTDDSIEILQSLLDSARSQFVNNTEILQGKIRGRDILAVNLTQNHGPSYSRNVGIDLTIQNTDYFSCLDCDDENYPDKIEKSVKILDEDPNIVGVYADYYIHNLETGNISYEFKLPYDRFILHNECIVHSGTTFRASAVNKIKDQYGYYNVNLRLCEDWDLWLRLSYVGTFYHIPEPLSLVRAHRNDSTNSNNRESWGKAWNYVQNRIKERYAANNT